jgi:hypothetical protein
MHEGGIWCLRARTAVDHIKAALSSDAVQWLAGSRPASVWTATIWGPIGDGGPMLGRQGHGRVRPLQGQGEAAVLSILPRSVNLLPLIVFEPEDAFSDRFAAMEQFSPVIPIVSRASKSQPVYVGDVADEVIGG